MPARAADRRRDRHGDRVDPCIGALPLLSQFFVSSTLQGGWFLDLPAVGLALLFAVPLAGTRWSAPKGNRDRVPRRAARGVWDRAEPGPAGARRGSAHARRGARRGGRLRERARLRRAGHPRRPRQRQGRLRLPRGSARGARGRGRVRRRALHGPVDERDARPRAVGWRSGSAIRPAKPARDYRSSPRGHSPRRTSPASW